MLSLHVDVPMAAFRPRWAREYQESFPAPPPSTVFGMLLSLIGVEREDKSQYEGVSIAIAIAEQSFSDEEAYSNGVLQRQRLFRKMRRVTNQDANQKNFDGRRPDYQEIILWLNLWIWVRDADSKSIDSRSGQYAGILTDNIRKGLNKTNDISRHGALCLGESTHLVNEIKEAIPSGGGRMLYCDNDNGFLTMPVWVDHANDESTIETFSFDKIEHLPEMPDEKYWITLMHKKIEPAQGN